jgi:hypothetical protein
MLSSVGAPIPSGDRCSFSFVGSPPPFGFLGGLVEPDKLRLTIEARREKAKALTDAGMSQREAAEALGVGVATVNRDLAFQNGTESVPELNASDRDARREAAIVGNEALAAVEVRDGTIIAA